MGSSLIVVGICSTKVVFACVTVNHTIPINKYLFQNGRLLLTCIVLLSPSNKIFHFNKDSAKPPLVYGVLMRNGHEIFIPFFHNKNSVF